MAGPREDNTNAPTTPPQLSEGKKPATVLTLPFSNPEKQKQTERVKAVADPGVSDLAIGYRILREMRRVTPEGAVRPWKTAENVGPIVRVLAAGEDEGSLLDHVRGASELVSCGEEAARWWYPGNVFGETTGPRWAARIAELRAAQARVARADAEREAYDARCRADAADVQAPLMTNIEIQRMARGVLAQMGAERDEDESEAG